MRGPKHKVRMSNAKSRLRPIEPVRMFDEQRVNIAGELSAYSRVLSLLKRERLRAQGQRTKGEGESRLARALAGVSAEVHGTRGRSREGPQIDLTS